MVMKTWGIALAAAAFALSGCSQGLDVDMAEVEDSIRVDLADQLDVPANSIDVECPQSIEWRVGEEFRCFAEDDTGRAKITVHMENEEGSFSWETE